MSDIKHTSQGGITIDVRIGHLHILLDMSEYLLQFMKM